MGLARSRFVQTGRSWLEPGPFLASGLGLTLLSGRHRRILHQLIDPGGLIQGLLLGVALYYATVQVVFRRVLSPQYYLDALRQLIADQRLSRRRMLGLAGRALVEEVVWRGTLQSMLGCGQRGILSTAGLFTLRHAYLQRRNRRKPAGLVWVEFLGFAWLLGFVYAGTGRLMIPIGMHWMRNVLISSHCAFPSERK